MVDAAALLQARVHRFQREAVRMVLGMLQPARKRIERTGSSGAFPSFEGSVCKQLSLMQSQHARHAGSRRAVAHETRQWAPLQSILQVSLHVSYAGLPHSGLASYTIGTVAHTQGASTNLALDCPTYC